MTIIEENFAELTDGDENPEAVLQHVRDLDQEAAELRAEICALKEALGPARAALANAIDAYQRQMGSKITPQDLIRQHLAESVREREAKKHAPPPAPEPCANSYIDRAAAQGRGNADTLARKNLQTGYRRGSLPSSLRGTRIVRRHG